MLHFDSSKFLDDADESFVSIDLNEDKEECDICHQCTDEPIVQVVLSDEFLRFEGSCNRYGPVTRSHQICLDKWSEIIERNLKFAKDIDSCTIYTKNVSSRDTLEKKNSLISNEVQCNLKNEGVKLKPLSESQKNKIIDSASYSNCNDCDKSNLELTSHQCK